MHPLPNRAVARNVLTAAVVAAVGSGAAGLTVGPALARTGAPEQVAAVQGTAGPASRPWPGHRVPGYPRAQLWITVREATHGPSSQWTLTCGPAGGTIPDPTRACSQLGHAWRSIAPPSRGVMCPMIDYGPQAVTIDGYWYGTWVSVRFGRFDGCQEARWNAVISALGLNAPPSHVNPGGAMKPARRAPGPPATR